MQNLYKPQKEVTCNYPGCQEYLTTTDAIKSGFCDEHRPTPDKTCTRCKRGDELLYPFSTSMWCGRCIETDEQVNVLLNEITNAEPVTAKYLSEKTKMSTGSVNTYLRLMVSAGIIIRVKDGRNYLYSIPRGETVIDFKNPLKVENRRLQREVSLLMKRLEKYEASEYRQILKEKLPPDVYKWVINKMGIAK